jgi:hypothetical protein
MDESWFLAFSISIKAFKAMEATSSPNSRLLQSLRSKQGS